MLIRNRFTPYFQVETQVQCHECGEATTAVRVEQTVFTLPTFDDLSRGSYLSSSQYQIDAFAKPPASNFNLCARPRNTLRHHLANGGLTKIQK